MEDDPIFLIVANALFIVGLVATFRIAHRNAKLVCNAKIQEKDGTLRPPTGKEQFLIAQHFAYDKGKHFWHIIVAGIIIVGVVILFLKFIIVPRLDL